MRRVLMPLVVAGVVAGVSGSVRAEAPSSPTRAERLQALAVVVRLDALKPELKLDTAIAQLVYELAGLPATTTPVTSTAAIETVLRELKTAHAVDAGPSVRLVLEQACRAAHTTVKGALKLLYVAEESQRGEFDVYSTDLGAIGFVARAGRCGDDTPVPYRFEVVSASSTAFSARATGTGALQGDVWEVNESGNFTPISTLCTPAR